MCVPRVCCAKVQRRKQLTWVQARVRMRAYNYSLLDLLRNRSPLLFCTIVSLLACIAIVVLLFASIVEISWSQLPRSIPQCTYGGVLRRSEWWHGTKYCVTFFPADNAPANATSVSTSKINNNNGTEEDDDDGSVSEWGFVKGFYPADMVPDPTPYQYKLVENPITTLAIMCIVVIPAVVLTINMVFMLMAELQHNFRRRKNENAEHETTKFLEKGKLQRIDEEAPHEVDDGTE